MKFRVFAVLLLFTSVWGFSQETQDEWFQGRPIRDIVFTGLRNVSQNELEALMNPFKGRNFNDTIFWEIQGRLYALEYFDRIEPSILRYGADSSEVVIRFTVVERPFISRINFIGNSGLRRNELLDVISSKVNDIYNQAKVRADIDAIISKYLEKGYPNVTVTSSEGQARDSGITLNFHITENERISISSIQFQGNSRFSDNTLRNQLSLKARSLLNNGAFQEAKLIADRETITKYYHDRGFVDAIVRDVTRSYSTDDKRTNLVLTFMIDEGPEFRFGGVTFEGNSIFSSDQLSRLVTHKTGDIVNMSRVEMDLQRVADIYFENGFIFNSILRAPQKDYQTNVLSIHITIVERSRAYIENIIVIGNNKTNTEVILREIPLEPGDIFSKAKVMDAMRNLYNLQYFSMIIPDTLPGSTENLMDLVFTVEEQPTIDVQFGLTFSGSVDPETFPISGLIKWNDRNISGTGNEMGIEVNSSIIDTTSVTVNYLHRWAFGLPLSLGVDFSANYSKRLATMNNQSPFFEGNEEYAYPDGFISIEEYDRFNRIPTRDYLMTYEQWYLSTGLSSGYRWSTLLGIFSISGGTRFGMINNFYDGDLYRPFDPALREGNNTWTPKNSLWLGLSLDQRDIFFDPSRGYFLYQRFGMFGLFNAEREHYLRTDTKAQYFHTLFNLPVTDTWSFRGVLAMHVGLSTILKQMGRNAGSLTPVIEDANKLAVDGMFIGRGWSSEYRNKGLLLLDSWVELRIPLVRGILAWDFFFDAAGVETDQGYYFGYNSRNTSNFTIENLRFGYGGGFRFTMPQFPIRLSLVKRFFVEDGNVRWVPGALFGNRHDPFAGMDLVMSFVISY